MIAIAHTAGPWIVARRDADIGGFTIEIGPGKLPVAIVPNNRRGEPEAGANAALIGAAPDMLDALRLIANAICASAREINSFDMKYVLDAIAKAEVMS